MTSILQSMVLVLLHQNGDLCLRPRYSAAALAPFAPKRKQGRRARWHPPGTCLVSIVTAHVTRTSRGSPHLDISAPREPARLGHSRGGLASSASRGLDPREGLGCFVGEDGPYGLLAPPRRGPQVGKFGDPCSQNADSSPRAQGAPRLGFVAKPRVKLKAPRSPKACGHG